MNDKKIKILLIDNQEIFRIGLRHIIGKLKYTELIGEFDNANDFLNFLDKDKPDIVFIDIELPGMNGIEASELALKNYNNLKIVALTTCENEECIQRMIDIGAKGYLIKNINKEGLEKAIQTVHNGGTYYSDELFDFFTKQIVRQKKILKKNIELTRREKEILQLLCEGLNNKEVADALFISERTVLGHKTNLMTKTNTKNSINLMAYAIKHKLVVI